MSVSQTDYGRLVDLLTKAAIKMIIPSLLPVLSTSTLYNYLFLRWTSSCIRLVMLLGVIITGLFEQFR